MSEAEKRLFEDEVKIQANCTISLAGSRKKCEKWTNCILLQLAQHPQSHVLHLDYHNTFVRLKRVSSSLCGSMDLSHPT
jgi:hypothetical protein